MSFATYLGGVGVETLRDVAEGHGGRLYVVGGNSTGSFPVFGGFDLTFGGNGDGVLAALTPTGQRLWSTYFGAGGSDEVTAVEIAPDGSLVVAGRAGPNLPGAQSGFQAGFGGGQQDGFICRRSSDGRLLYWCSYLGTGDDHAVHDIAVDGRGFIYVVAGVERGGFPAAWFRRGMWSARRGGKDLLLMKLSPNGSGIVWATYLGGRGDEVNATVRANESGEALVALTTASRELPTTPDAAQRRFGGQTDIWVARFNAEGAFVFGTYLGGSGLDAVGSHGLAIDHYGRYLVAGSTTTARLAGSARGFQTAFAGGGRSPSPDLPIHGDGFVTLLSQGGRDIIATSYLGGSAADGVEAVSVDVNRVVWLTGATHSTNFRATSGAHQAAVSGGRDGFVVGATGDLKQLIYASLLGSEADDAGLSIAGRWDGGAFVAGSISGANFPTMGAVQSRHGGTVDGLVVGIR
ncbi:MAG: hypothetical protein FJ206_12585 [Gemmatimonadetes bacterium]|nr:hypothetical protein [Gemmatimonadota bacterium]